MRQYFSIIYKPEQTFQKLMESDDGQHGTRINIIILLTMILPIAFSAVYDFFIPFDPNSVNSPIGLTILSFIFPAIISTIIGFGIFKFLLPFLLHLIGQNYSRKVTGIAQTRFIVALSLIPSLIISPLKSLWFIENPILQIMIHTLTGLAALNSIIILFTGTKMIYEVDNKQSIIIISPFIILTILSSFLVQG